MPVKDHLVSATKSLALLFFLTASAGICAAAQPTPILPDGAAWEKVSEAGVVFGEGAVSAPDGKVYFSSMTRGMPADKDPGGTIFQYDPATGKTVTFLEPSGMSNGLHIDANGNLLIAQDSGSTKGGGRAIASLNIASGKITILADSYQGKHFNGPNDITTDSKGRVYFTDARYGGPEPMEMPNAFYRIDRDGTVTRLAADLLRPNGIEVSPDGRHLYVAAANSPGLPANPNGPAQDAFGITLGGIAIYDLDDSGNVSNGRLFFRNDKLMVDGMAMDNRGNIYAAMHNGNAEATASDIIAFDPEGKILGHLPVPAQGLTTNLGFGSGDDAQTLYLTTAFPIGLYRIATLQNGK